MRMRRELFPLMADARLAVACLVALSLLAMGGAAVAETNSLPLKKVEFSFEGPFGKFDKAEVQRGAKVYMEVCSSCHGMSLMSYRNLCQVGGPFYSDKHKNPNEAPICKAIAGDVKVPDIDQDTGDAITRPATPADHFKNPYPNEQAARASNGGALPPDLSDMARAREGGPAYIYSILTGYVAVPGGLTVPAGKYYNPYMPGDMGSYWSGPKDKAPAGGFIAMPFQLTPGRVTFDDGTPSTTDNQAKAVSSFLAWTAEPHQTERKQMGFAVLAFLIGFAVLMWLAYKQLWKNIEH